MASPAGSSIAMSEDGFHNLNSMKHPSNAKTLVYNGNFNLLKSRNKFSTYIFCTETEDHYQPLTLLLCVCLCAGAVALLSTLHTFTFSLSKIPV